MKKILSVTELSSYIYCPRKFFLERIKGIRKPATQPMIEGSIRHKVVEEFANNEKNFVITLPILSKEKIIERFNDLLENLISNIFSNNYQLIQKHKINHKELREKIKTALKNDIELRAESLAKSIQNFQGVELWKNLSPKYISEVPVYSENLGLKGRIDRLMISDESIIPYELKTRESNKIWPSDEAQLTAYAMLTQEKYNKEIPLAILEAGNTKHELLIKPEMKAHVKQLVREIQCLYEQEAKAPQFPDSFAKCRACSHKDECDKLN